MEWLNLHSSVLDSPEVIGEDPVNRATWLFLLRYCIGQENGGRIEGARAWGDRKWQQLIRVTKREILRDASLWNWDGDALIVFAYPCDRERLVKSKREVARENGLRGGRPKHNPSETKQEPTLEPSLVISEKAEGEREGEGERKDKGNLEIGFEIFAAYPRRVGKQDALKAIKKALTAHPANAHEILEATKAYAAATALWPEAERKFIPHPATWFNRGSYEDDPATWTRNGQTALNPKFNKF